MKILVIDPDKTMREVLIKTLGQSDVFSPFEAEDIAGGLSLASNEKPEFIFIDFDAFSDDPVNSIKQIKKSSPGSNVILISGVGADENIVRQALNAGASSGVSKPFRIEEIKHAMGVSSSKSEVVVETDKSSSASGGKRIGPVGKKIFLTVVSLAAAALAVAAFLYLVVLKPHPQPSATFPSGLKNISYISATSDGRLLLTDWQEQIVYFYQMPRSPLEKSLVPLASMKNKDVQPSAAALLSAKNNEVAITDSLQGVIFVVRPEFGKETLPTVVSKCVILKTHKSPDASPSGILVVKGWLHWKARGVWTYDSVSKKVYRHNPQDFSVMNVYDLPVENPTGMAFMGGRFYVGESSSGRIIELNPSDMSVSAIIRPRVYSAVSEGSGEHLCGLTSDGRNLWTISESGVVYRHHPSEFQTDIK